jgi:DNA-binding response OmpR family regulator
MGADSYVTKPFDPDHLLDAVNKTLRLAPEQLAARRAVRARAVGTAVPGPAGLRRLRGSQAPQPRLRGVCRDQVSPTSSSHGNSEMNRNRTVLAAGGVQGQG